MEIQAFWLFLQNLHKQLEDWVYVCIAQTYRDLLAISTHYTFCVIAI